MLIKNGADVHGKDVGGQTAMFEVTMATDGMLAFKVLIKHGADVQGVSPTMGHQ